MNLAKLSYPPVPWRMTGQIWMALAPAEEDVPLPGDLKPVLRRRVAIDVVRYTSGTLLYNELACGPIVRRGRHVGVLARHIWVDSAASLRGGRRLWGIPKQLAEFTWDGGSLSVHTDGEHLVSLTVDPPGRRFPAPPLPAAGFGDLDGQRIYLPGRAHASLARTTLRIGHWHHFLPALTEGKQLRVVAAESCRFTYPAGRVLGSTAPTRASR